MMKLRRNGWLTGNALRTAMVLAMCAAGASSLAGCSKPKPPPPPPPPPKQEEPPPPPPVSFDSISQDMKADPRVQFASDLSLDDEEVARAVVSFADALARGDLDTLSRLSTKPTRQVLEQIKEMGGLGGDIEAVRVVYIGKNDDEAGLKTSFDSALRMFAPEEGEGTSLLPPDVMAKLTETLATAFKGDEDANFDPGAMQGAMSPEKLQQLAQAMEQLRDNSEKSTFLQQIESLLTSSTAVPGLEQAQFVALIAVQTPSGVELTGWGLEKAFGKWTFNRASTDRTVKNTASEWDGIGVRGFSRDSSTGIYIAAAPSEDGDDDSDDSSDGGSDNPGEQQAPPKEKRTPGGPVKIPGG